MASFSQPRPDGPASSGSPDLPSADGDAGCRREGILDAVADAAERFLSGASWQEVAPAALSGLGAATGASRAYLFEIHPGDDGRPRWSQRVEWAAPGVEPQIDNPDLVGLDPGTAGFARWDADLGAGQPVLGRVAEFPAPERPLLEAQGILSLAVVPVRVGASWWGFLGLDDCTTGRAWSDAELGGLRTAAGVLGAALARERAETALRASEERFRVLVDNVPGVVYLCRNDSRYTMLWVSDEVAELTGHPAAAFTEDRVSFVELYHPDDAATITRQVDAALAERRRFLLTYRLRHADGRWVWVEERGQGVFDEAGELLYLEGSLVDVTARRQAEELLVHRTLHDPLTGLPNRALLLDRLGVCLGRAARLPRYRFAVLVLDLDRFKLVNEGLGHGAGDALLIEVAQRIRHILRPGDTLARLGGDEFAVLLEDLGHTSHATAVAERLGDVVAAPFHAAPGHEVFPGASIGLAFNAPGYRQPEELLRDADTAMYRAKAEGRGRVAIFEPDMHGEAVERLRLDSELRRAVEREELALVFQPIVRLDRGSPVAVEALLRWQHPERGLLAPAAFLDTAAECGLLRPIGRWVLAESCRQARDWQRLHPGLVVHVNLHAQELADPGLVAAVGAALAGSDLPAGCLNLELTEQAVMAEPEQALEVLGSLRALGVQLSIDDFGSGYSSLSYLHRLPITTLKVDRSFLGPIGGSADGHEVLRAIGALGRALGLEAVAEGVETPAQRDVLRDLGYELGQGYHFARPLTPESISSLLGAA